MDDEQQLDVASRIGGLLYKFVSETITDDERTELYSWVYSSKENQELFEEVVYSEEFQESIEYVAGIDRDAAFRSIQERMNVKEEKPLQIPIKRRRVVLAVAASVALLISVLGYFYMDTYKKSNKTIVASPIVPANDLLPGAAKAKLTLANGQVISLGANLEKDLGTQGSASVKELVGGKLNYTAESQTNQVSEIAFNVLVTPRAAQFQVILSDGTKVWLNNASSLKYPATFVGPAREVQLQGEAYFEVAHNVSKPFLVKTRDLTIQDLGTSFNVKAYSEEQSSKITLVNGSVKIGDLTLRPGQQAVSEGTGLQLSKKPNIEQALAWKNGYFQFDRTDIKEVMRELSRWYDVDRVIYEGKQTHRTFSGTIPRDYNAADVLKILEMVDVHFRIEGKTIVVTD
jgi:transmembrane sensor